MKTLTEWLKELFGIESARTLVQRAHNAQNNPPAKDAQNKKNPADNASQVQANEAAAYRIFQRITGHTAGLEQFKGDLKDASKFMQSKDVPSLLPNTYDMIASLQNACSSGTCVQADLAVGGQSLVDASIASANASRDAIDKENEENEEDPLEAFLRYMYRLLTGKEPLDSDGNETNEYKVWRAEYILELGDAFVELYNARNTS